MKNVLIISYSFPPLNNIAARRFGEMVNYMERNGWKPYIITTKSQGSLPVYVSEEQCIRIGLHPQQNSRIENIDVIANELPSILKNLKNVLAHFNLRFRAVDRTVLIWGTLVKKEIDIIMKKFPEIDLILASYGPSASLWIGKWFATKYHVPWIVDFRDLAALRRDDRPWLAYIADCIIERKVVKKCSGFTTVSEHLSNLISQHYGKQCKVIYNGYNKKSGKLTEINDHEIIYIYYAGQFYNHRMNAVYYLLDALVQFKSVYFKVRSLGPLNLEKKIIAYANKIGVQDRVEILSPASSDIVEIEAQQATANVVFEDMDTTNKWAAGTLTGKFLQLLPGTVPIMSIARHDNEMNKILERSERGSLCCSVDQIESFLAEAINEPKHFIGNSDIVNEFSKERQAEKLCSFFDVIVDDE